MMIATILIAAEWIAGSYAPPAETETAEFFKPARNDVVEKRFAARDAAVTRAVWRVAAPGLRDLSVNGTRVSPTALPPLTPYRKRILEESFDVTDRIRRGAENVLRVELGNGWFNPLPIRMWFHYNLREHLAVGTPCVKATLEIDYADGRRETVETDESWAAAKGRVVKNSIYLGVMEDRRLEVAFAEQARKVPGPEGTVVPAGDFPKVVVYDRWTAKSVTQVSNGVWLVDMGVNAAGTLRARLRGVPAGAKVVFRQGERVWPDGTVNVLSSVAGQIKDPKRGPLFAIAEQRDSVIGDGTPEFVFEPRLTFHVFRYVQVEGTVSAPRAEDFEMLAWSADVKERSHVTCSNEKLNRLHEVCRRTFRSNLQSVQSDCPGREKFGYGGDIACTIDAFWSNYDMTAFYRKVLQDFLDEAADDGLFTETAPFVGIASRSCYPSAAQADRRSMTAAGGTRAAPIGWAAGVPIIVDTLVRYAGDLESMRRAYPALVRFVDLLQKRYPKHDIPDCLGDWIAIPSDKANCRLSGLAHWHQFVSLTAKFARLLGKEADAVRLGRHADEIAATFRREFVHADGRVGSGFQGEQLFALYHGLLEEKDVAAAYEVLKADIHAHGDALTTGIFTTKYMFEYLPLHGDAALAAKVAMHEGFPGWFHMLDRGATTLWEDWSEERCLDRESNCHPMFGSVDEWMVRHVLGVSVCDDAVGCDKVRICPQVLPGITSASGWFDTPKGRITVAWKSVGGRVVVEKSVPPGITVEEPAAQPSAAADKASLLRELGETGTEVPESALRMVPQEGAAMAVVTAEPRHVSIWDYNISPSGEHYFSVCSEGTVSSYARLYRYLPGQNEVRRVFRLEDVIVTRDEAVRPSKLHSSIDFMPDGRVIMATHTTAAAPNHPRWMPFAYYPDLREGYPGSNILVYDPKSGKTEDLGVPVVHESVYGGTYEATTHSYYFTGYHRGHVYRFDLATRKVTDFGQAVEYGTWRWIHAADGNLYTTTASGRLVRLNIARQRIEDVPFDFPIKAELMSIGTNNKMMHYAADGNGFWFTALSCDRLMRYDIATASVTVGKSFVPKCLGAISPKARCMGMCADETGTLWLLAETIGIGQYLVSIDAAAGGEPVCHGLCGVPERAMGASFGCFVRDGVLYASDTNRGNDPPAVFQVPLATLREGKPGPIVRDARFYLSLRNGEALYRKFVGRELLADADRFLEGRIASEADRVNPARLATLPVFYREHPEVRFNGDLALNVTALPHASRWVCKLWKRFGHLDFTSLGFLADGTVWAQAGGTRYLMRGGELVGTEPAKADPANAALACAEKARLPYQPERRHLCRATAACGLSDGRVLAGTQDGMLAIVRPNGDVFSLGGVGLGQTVHDLAPFPGGRRALGVAAGPDALGTVFTYDDEKGLVLHGRVFFQDRDSPGVLGASNDLRLAAVSPDGKCAAIAVGDQLSCVYWFELKDEIVD